MSDSNDDARFAALPSADVSEVEAERVRHQAQRILAREVQLRDRPAARAFDRYWVRRAEPALLATASVYYFVWALAVVAV